MTPRREQVARLFQDGRQVIWRLGLVMFYADTFHESVRCRTGLGKSAHAAIAKGGIPEIYLGTRGTGFDKTLDLELYKKFKRDKSRIWRHAAEHARAGNWVFVEYANIFDDPEIGAFISDDSDDHIRATVAHELAHAVHLWHQEHGIEIDKKPHGETWRRIYRALRVAWVNPLLPDQEITS